MRKGNHIDRVKSAARSSESAIQPQTKRERDQKKERKRGIGKLEQVLNETPDSFSDRSLF